MPLSPTTYHEPRRPPLPPSLPRASSKVAVIRPNSAFAARSPSPYLRSISSPTPRRMFPQESPDELDLDELSKREQAPVVFDASLNFVLGIDRQKVRSSFRPTASHLEPQTASSCLSTKISSFLQRTDHIMDEWKRIGRSDECESPDSSRRLRSRSATNIMIKGYQLFSRASSVASRPGSRLSVEDDATICEEEVVWGDFACFETNENV